MKRSLCIPLLALRAALFCCTTHAMEPQLLAAGKASPHLEMLIPVYQGFRQTCATHTLCNAYTLTQLRQQGVPITAEAIRQQSRRNYHQCRGYDDDNLTPDDVAECANVALGPTLKRHNTVLIGFDRAVGTLRLPQIVMNHPHEEEPFEAGELGAHQVEDFCAGQTDVVNFLINTCRGRVENGHWSLISLLRENGLLRMVHLDSAAYARDVPERISQGTCHAAGYIARLLHDASRFLPA